MRVILKPFGLITLGGAMVALTSLAVWGVIKGVGNPPEKSPRFARIYLDQLQNGWTINGWASKIQSDSSRLTFQGRRAIQAKIDRYLGVKFMHNPLGTGGYDRLTFAIHGGPQGGQKFQVQALLSGKKTGTRVLLDTLPANRWVRVTVPLKDLLISDKPDLSHFWIQDTTGLEQPDCYIDDVRFLVPGEAPPDGEALMTSVAPRENW